MRILGLEDTDKPRGRREEGHDDCLSVYITVQGEHNSITNMHIEISSVLSWLPDLQLAAPGSCNDAEEDAVDDEEEDEAEDEQTSYLLQHVGVVRDLLVDATNVAGL